MELTVLGCGDAFGNGGRNNTSFLLSNNEEHVLLDCGSSTAIRLKHERVDLDSISTIIITHFHGDHYGGIPFFLIISLFECPRKSPLKIVGPIGIEQRVVQLLETMYAGTAEKLSALDLQFFEYKQGTPLSLGDKIIHAWEVEHSPPSIPHAIRLEWDGKSVAFSGDTSWTDNLIPLSKDTDLFICECNFMESVSFGHLSYTELLEKADQFQTRQLWLSHMNEDVIKAPNFQFNRLSDGQRISL